MAHPLSRTWVIWEHRTREGESYGQSMSPVGSVESVESFWQCWRHLPAPSLLFGSPQSASDEHRIESLSIFVSGVRPEWEEPENAVGGELYCRRVQPHQLDRLWNTLVLAVVGASLPTADAQVTGVRVVNKSQGSRAAFRVEVWLRSEQASVLMREGLARLLQQASAEFGEAEPMPAAEDASGGGAAATGSIVGARSPCPAALCFRRPCNLRGLTWEYRGHQKKLPA